MANINDLTFWVPSFKPLWPGARAQSVEAQTEANLVWRQILVLDGHQLEKAGNMILHREVQFSDSWNYYLGLQQMGQERKVLKCEENFMVSLLVQKVAKVSVQWWPIGCNFHDPLSLGSKPCVGIHRNPLFGKRAATSPKSIQWYSMSGPGVACLAATAKGSAIPPPHRPQWHHCKWSRWEPSALWSSAPKAAGPFANPLQHGRHWWRYQNLNFQLLAVWENNNKWWHLAVKAMNIIKFWVTWTSFCWTTGCESPVWSAIQESSLSKQPVCWRFQPDLRTHVVDKETIRNRPAFQSNFSGAQHLLPATTWLSSLGFTEVEGMASSSCNSCGSCLALLQAEMAWEKFRKKWSEIVRLDISRYAQFFQFNNVKQLLLLSIFAVSFVHPITLGSISRSCDVVFRLGRLVSPISEHRTTVRSVQVVPRFGKPFQWVYDDVCFYKLNDDELDVLLLFFLCGVDRDSPTMFGYFFPPCVVCDV